jgi:hypothetical protein
MAEKSEKLYILACDGVIQYATENKEDAQIEFHNTKPLNCLNFEIDAKIINVRKG